ncbi:MAG: OsmC family protein [Solirubrobacterales bacterium]
MPLTTFKATVRKGEGLSVECNARNFNISLDEPENMGGANTGMNPAEVILCGLGACQTILASSFAEKQGIDLQEFWVELNGDIDTDGFMGLSDVRPGYSIIRYTIHIRSNSPEDKIYSFIDFIENRCPMGDTLKNQVKLEKTGVIIEK